MELNCYALKIQIRRSDHHDHSKLQDGRSGPPCCLIAYSEDSLIIGGEGVHSPYRSETVTSRSPRPPCVRP